MSESLFNKVAGLQARNVIKKKLQQRCFPVKFAEYLRTPFFTEHLRWLLLYLIWTLYVLLFSEFIKTFLRQTETDITLFSLKNDT